MRIAGLPSVGGPNPLRVTGPLEALYRHGHEVTFPPPMTLEQWQAQDITGWDTAVGHCPAIGGLKLWNMWRGRVPLVADVDDEVTDDLTRDGLAHSRDMKLMFTAEGIAASTRCLQISDLVTVSTPVLADRYSKHNRNIRVLPATVHEDVLHVRRPRRDKVTVGWHGSASHYDDFFYHSTGLREFFDTHPDVDLHMIGANYGTWCGRPDCRTGPYRSLRLLYHDIDFDIGIAPVRPGFFNDAKTWMKVLEYGALGIPSVASASHPAYQQYVLHGETGYLARTDDEWVRYLTQLAADKELREAMGRRAREHARKHTIQAKWKLWETAYATVSR